MFKLNGYTTHLVEVVGQVNGDEMRRKDRGDLLSLH